MNRHIATLKGEYFFRDNMLFFVNRASENFSGPLHNHDFIEFTYVAEGKGFHHVGDDVQPVHKGEMFYIPVGISHVFRPAASDSARHPLFVYNCVVSPRLLDKMELLAVEPSIAGFIQSMKKGEQPFLKCQDPDGTLERLFVAMHREYMLARDGSGDYMVALIMQLIVSTYRSTQHTRVGSAPRNNQIEPLLQFLELYYDQEMTLARLAEFSQWSERHIQRMFKRHTGQTFNRYLQDLRIRNSCELLASTELKVASIAEAVGYRDIDSFLTVFKRNVGTTPSEYRKQKKFQRGY